MLLVEPREPLSLREPLSRRGYYYHHVGLLVGVQVLVGHPASVFRHGEGAFEVGRGRVLVPCRRHVVEPHRSARQHGEPHRVGPRRAHGHGVSAAVHAAVVVLAACRHAERARRLAVDADLRGGVGASRHAHGELAHCGALGMRERHRLALTHAHGRSVEEVAAAGIPAVAVFLVQAVAEVGRGIE